jgi:hypothetical protein
VASLVALSALIGAVGAVGSVASSPDAVSADTDPGPDPDAPWTLPSMPPACTSAQVASVQISGCLLGGSTRPEQRGWGEPPFPVAGDPSWVWRGWAYDGSPALAEWEASQLVDYGGLRAHVAAIGLFHGFLTEIRARGYTVAGAGAYSFRCTSNSKRDCIGLTRSSLSNHAWGIAIDISAGANPEVTYVRTGGVTACAQPMQTDIPQWVVTVAQSWGLYWGGYGWSGGGCATPATEKDSVIRDPTHFEFRGDVATAEAIAKARGVATLPGLYCRTTTSTTGRDMRSCTTAGVPGTGWRMPIATGAPKGTVAVLANITAVDATAPGYFTAEPCALSGTAARTTSNVNYTTTSNAANLSIVPVDASGRFCLWRSSPAHSLVDVQGFVIDPAAAIAAGVPADDLTTYHPVTPWRALDSRTSGACAPDGSCTEGPASRDSIGATRLVDVRDGARAVMANLTIVDTPAPGYITADRCSGLGTGIQDRSNANHGVRDTVANLAVVPVDPLGPNVAAICTYTSAGGHLLTDVQGYHGSGTAGLRYALTSPRRVLDTRACTRPVTGVPCGERAAAGQVVPVDLGSDADVVAVNLTIADATRPGYATIGDCATLRAGVPPTSNNNFTTGVARANMALVGRSPAGVCVFTSAPANVIVDVQGELRQGASAVLQIRRPTRVHDTR